MGLAYDSLMLMLAFRTKHTVLQQCSHALDVNALSNIPPRYLVAELCTTGFSNGNEIFGGAKDRPFFFKVG